MFRDISFEFRENFAQILILCFAKLQKTFAKHEIENFAKRKHENENFRSHHTSRFLGKMDLKLGNLTPWEEGASVVEYCII